MNFRDDDFLNHLMINLTRVTFENPNTQKLLRDPNQKFDAVIGEWLLSEVYATLGNVFDCPMIWFSTLEPHSLILYLVNGPLNPAYSADYLSTIVPPFSFTERVHELWILLQGIYRRNFNYYYREDEIYQQFIVPILKEQGKKVPSYDDIKFNASLVLGNSHLALGNAASLPQNYIHIGGYHIDEDVKPLPKDLKNIMDNAKNGVVYFSLGSNVRSKDLPMEIKRGLLEVFSRLKETVIWKFEETLPDTPENVHIVHWAPQQSILAHPNAMVFVTHGGILSMTETVHFGVPIIAIPVFADQFANSKIAEKKGFGKKVELSYTLHKDLEKALDDVLNNPKYKENAKLVSQAYHSTPTKPKDALAIWVNHVILTLGAPHLRSPGHKMPMYQRLFLDLIILILISISVIIFVLKLTLRIVLNKGKKKEKRS